MKPVADRVGETQQAAFGRLFSLAASGYCNSGERQVTRNANWRKRPKPAGHRSEEQIFNAQGARTGLALFGRYWSRCQSNLIPAFFATPAHLAISDLMCSAKYSGVLPTGSTA